MVAILISVRWYLTVLLVCTSLINQWCWSSFHVLFDHLYVFGEMSIHFKLGCLFSYWAKWAVCLFWRIPCWPLHLQKFPPILWGCLSVVFMVSFAVNNLLSLIRFHLFIFVFIFVTLGGGSKKIVLQITSESILPMFSSRSFIVSGLTFRSLIHFEFVFVCSVRKCSCKCSCKSFLFHVAVQFSQHHLLKKWYFLCFIFLPPLT